MMLLKLAASASLCCAFGGGLVALAASYLESYDWRYRIVGIAALIGIAGALGLVGTSVGVLALQR